MRTLQGAKSNTKNSISTYLQILFETVNTIYAVLIQIRSDMLRPCHKHLNLLIWQMYHIELCQSKQGV